MERPLPTHSAPIPIIVPEGEAAKDWATLHQLLAGLAERGVSRDTPIIALGGGSVGDLAGLAAALFKRGCPIVHLPTTLLAQADSAIGGKTAIDAFGEKNLIGTFHQPSLVVADPAFLDTLDRAAAPLRLCRSRQIWPDRRSRLLRLVRGQRPGRARRPPRPSPASYRYCDPGQGADRRRRRRRPSGQTRPAQPRSQFRPRDRGGGGHRIHASRRGGCARHDPCIPLFVGARASVRPPIPSGSLAHLAACDLPTRLADVGLADRGGKLINWMIRDKKNRAGRIALVLTRGIGRAYLDPAVDAERLSAFLDRAP